MKKNIIALYISLRYNIIRKWDEWVYHRAFYTLRRMVINNPGFSYLMELQIREWNSTREISPDLKSATEAFHKSMPRNYKS